MNVYKSRGKRIFEIVHWPFELPPNMHRPAGPFSWHKWCSLPRPSKGQCTISKIFSSLIFSSFIEQNIFFPGTCFAFTISEPKMQGVYQINVLHVLFPFFKKSSLHKSWQNISSNLLATPYSWINLDYEKHSKDFFMQSGAK